MVAVLAALLFFDLLSAITAKTFATRKRTSIGTECDSQ